MTLESFAFQELDCFPLFTPADCHDKTVLAGIGFKSKISIHFSTIASLMMCFPVMLLSSMISFCRFIF